MVKISITVFLVFILVYNYTFSQSIADYQRPDKFNYKLDSISSIQFLGEENYAWHNMITNLPNDFCKFGETSINSINLQNLLGVGTVTGVLMIVDNDLHEGTKQRLISNPFLKNTTDVTVHIGDGKTSLALAAGLSAYGLLAGEKKYVNTSIKVVESMIAGGLCVQLLKRITGRESPAVATEKGGMWRFFPSWKLYQKNQRKYYSFPSGHITTITSTMTVLCNSFPDSKYMRPLSYGLITLTGLGLIQKDMHWYSDFPLALFIGYNIGNIVAPVRRINWFTEKTDMNFALMTTPTEKKEIVPGVQIGWSF